MADVIQLLPDSIANQIAAGEVVQRPASVVKELVENSIDAGSKTINVCITDGGRTLIQVVDDGGGMSETDARMSFERHATSKIRNTEDLFHIHTMGFRGEALASIAAVAHVTLKTRRPEDDIGTELHIKGSKVDLQEPATTPAGSNLQVKNLFFNVPARRKFLKTNSTEFRHILTEFQRVALCHPEIKFVLQHNGNEIYNLPESNLRQRIIHVFGKSMNSNLATVNTKTSIVKIHGFIGKPQQAKKKMGEQYFFINGRYMRHPYFHKAVMNAYDQILAPGTFPSYFIYFEADPGSIDVNIHPTKTEIKFENEQAIFQILQASVKEGLGKFNLVPSIDFETSGLIDIPVASRGTDIAPPSIDIDTDYNPFVEQKKPASPDRLNNAGNRAFKKEIDQDWQSLYQGFEQEHRTSDQKDLGFETGPPHEETTKPEGNRFFQLKNRFILSSVKSGLMVIDQKRAHERVLYERFLVNLIKKQSVTQRSLFPVEMELTREQESIWKEIKDELQNLGFNINEAKQKLIIEGHPADLGNENPVKLLEDIFESFLETPDNLGAASKETLALKLAQSAAISHGTELSQEEMQDLVDSLFAAPMPNFSPTGKTIISIINFEELMERFY